MCYRKEKMIINDRAKMFLYQITNAAIQLTETEINNALQEVDCSAIEKNKFATAIDAYRLNGSHLILKKRHPVLLVLDEVLLIIINTIIFKFN